MQMKGQQKRGNIKPLPTTAAKRASETLYHFIHDCWSKYFYHYGMIMPNLTLSFTPTPYANHNQHI
jgi:hypothetical protein